MIRKIVAAGLAGATLLAATSVIAQDAPPPKHRDPMTRGDTNGDGMVSRDEVLAKVDKRFAKMDANKDGKITAEEGPGKRRMARAEGGEGKREGMRGAGGGNGRGARGLARLDLDKDGAVSLAEQRAQATRRFDYVDRNADGKIDQAEREALAEVAMGMRGPGRHGMRGPGHHGMRGHRGPPPAGAPNAPQGE